MSGPLDAAVDRAVRCLKCGKNRMECRCWLPCGCGRLKERGAPECPRCQEVIGSFVRVGPSRYEATDGVASIVTCREGIHWTFYLRVTPKAPLVGGHTLTNTNRNAKALGTYAMFRMLDSPAED